MHRQVRRIVSANLVVALAATLVLAACSGSSSTPGTTAVAPASGQPASAAPEDVRISVVYYAKVIAYFNDMMSGMQAKADELGVTLDVAYANFDVEEQKNLIDTAIGTSPSGMIIAPFNPAAFLDPLKTASEGGIPAIMVGNDVDEASRPHRLAFVGPSFEEMGARKAQWIADQLGGEGTVIVIHGPKGIDFVEGMRRGYEEVFAGYPDIEVIEGPYGNIASDIGRQSTEDMLTAHPNPSAIMYDSEDLAVGGVEAMKDMGIDQDSILVVASDGVKTGFDLIRSGWLDMTVSENAYVNGLTAIQVLYDNIVKGVEPSDWVEIELVTITADNIDSLPENILPPGQ